MFKDHFNEVLVLLSLLLTAAVASCSSQETGTLQFRANGEDFVRQGFVSKDGWSINFNTVEVTLDNITAYQTDPPYEPQNDPQLSAQSQVDLGGPFTVDLAEGDEAADTILVGDINDAPAGHYNAISWQMVPGDSGYPLVIIGSATKDGQTIDFTINVDEDFTFSCGDFVGDVRKGILEADGSADMEMTFHFDHIFGDAGSPADDDLNLGAPGFEPFASAAQGGNLEMSVSDMQSVLSADDYQLLVGVLPSLGHVGEGHCHYGEN